MPRRKISIRTALVIRMVAVIVAAVGVGGVYTYIQVTRQADALGERVINQTSVLIDQRLGSLINKVETQARFLARTAKPALVNGDRRPLDSSRFPVFAANAVEALSVQTDLAAVALTLDSTGESVIVNRRSSGPIVVQIDRLQNKKPVSVSQIPFVNQFLDVERKDGWLRDRRQDESYLRCKEEMRPVWSGVRLIGARSAENPGVPGVECTVPVLNTESRFVGTVTVAISLDNLGVFLLNTRVGENGFAFVVELNDQGELKIVADPQPQSNPDSTSFATADTVEEPVRRAVLRQIAQGPDLQAGHVTKLSFTVNNVDYIGGLKRVTDKPGPTWAMVIVAPQEDFFASSRQTLVFFATFSLLAVAVGTIVALLFARRFAAPLRQLSEETARIRTLELEGSPLPPTKIREIDVLGESIEALKSGLRSMEKLVPKEYAQHLIASGQEAKLGGERRHITVSFGDLVGFTKLSHQLPPEELMVVLAEYLDVLSNEVQTYGGTIDKFNGDDVMAFWGAPTAIQDHALQAVKSALSCLDALTALHVEWREEGRPILNASFGIATGDVIVGNVGNQKRMNYTVIGDSVNLASRLQAINKFFSTNILIAQNTLREASPEILARIVDIVCVYNREEPERIYEPVALQEHATVEQRKLVETHNAAFQAYERRMFTKAAQLFEEVLKIKPQDGPASVLHARCQELAQNPPPENWTGANELLFK